MAKGKKSVKSTKTSRRLTLQNLLADGSEIWVTNRSGEATGKEAGNIVLQVGNGTAIDKVLIPPGKDPVCLTDQVTPKLLADCMDLFKLVKGGVLELMPPEMAEEYYAKHVARKDIVDSKIDRLTAGTPNATLQPQKSKSANVEINPKVGDICLKAKHAAITESEALERLFEQEAVLTMDDYSYLSMNGVFNGVKRWAKEQISEIMKVADAELQEYMDDPVNAAAK